MKIPEDMAQAYINRLVDNIAAEVDNPAVLAAFRAVPRHHFFQSREFYYWGRDRGSRINFALNNTPLEDWLKFVYSDNALHIEEGDEKIYNANPLCMARLFDALDIQPGMTVLEIGTGTGYDAALLAHLLGEKGRLISIERQPELYESSRKILAELPLKNITLLQGDGIQGVAEHGPYDRIITAASFWYVPPAWINQLAICGKIIATIAASSGVLLVEKHKNRVEGRYLDFAEYLMWLVQDEQLAELRLEMPDFESLTTDDFAFFKALFYPAFSFYVTKEKQLHFSSIGDNRRACLYADGRLKLEQGDDELLRQIERIIKRWFHLGKPKRSDYRFQLEADGRQILYIGSEAVREIKP